MGYRMYVAKKFQIEYDLSVGGFNWCIEEVNDFLCYLADQVDEYPDYSFSGNSPSCSTMLEFSKDLWELMLSEMYRRDSKEIAFVQDGNLYSVGDLTEFMEHCKANSDPDNPTIHLCWM